MAPSTALVFSSDSMMSDVPVKAVTIAFAVATYAPAGTVMLVIRENPPAGWFSGPALRTCS